eukprot:SAG22_NODE_2_length_61565_cov_858.782010_17_plen_42_part_00
MIHTNPTDLEKSIRRAKARQTLFGSFAPYAVKLNDTIDTTF